MAMPIGNRENPQFYDSERLKTLKTDCVLKVYKDKDFYQLGLQVCWLWKCRGACHLNSPSVICYSTLWYQSISKSHCPVLYLSIMQRTPLHIAVKEFRVKTAEFLVDNKADINSKDKDGVCETTAWWYLLLQCSLSLLFPGTQKRILHSPFVNY